MKKAAWLTAFALVAALAPTAVAEPCLIYSTDVTLRGVLADEAVPQDPDEEKINGKTKDRYFFITPEPPFCVAEGKDNEHGLEPAEPKVERVQLVFIGKTRQASFEALKPLLGQQLVCVGRLFHAITGHHHTDILLEAAECHAAPAP